MTDESFDLKTVTNRSAEAQSGIPHTETLMAFTEALVKMDEAALTATRARVLDELGPEALVDAAGVASNFERMVRIADSTGIPLDKFLADTTTELREDLGINQFHSVTHAA